MDFRVRLLDCASRALENAWATRLFHLANVIAIALIVAEASVSASDLSTRGHLNAWEFAIFSLPLAELFLQFARFHHRHMTEFRSKYEAVVVSCSVCLLDGLARFCTGPA